ncbi:MAG: molecular chaperone TorD family protein [Smithella sp.]|jgi:TorA maturation chaperone TorD
MTTQEKEQICSIAATLFSPPDALLVDDLDQEGFRLLLVKCFRKWGCDPEMVSPFIRGLDRDLFLGALQSEYERLFTALDGLRISLVESTYKPWTLDKDCGVIFAASKGLVMGDWAAHLLDIYECLSLEIPEDFRSTPDHLVLELEFLSLLHQSAPKEWISTFVEDHLDWIPELKKEIDKAGSSPFYRNSVEFVQLFLEHETNDGKVKDHGKKRIC